MQFRLVIGAVIFLGSYLPLSLILLAQNFDYAALDTPLCLTFWHTTCSIPLRNPSPAIGFFGVCCVCFAITLLALQVVKPKHQIVIGEAKHVPTDLMNYTLPYVVSFMSIDYQETGKFVGFAIFLGWMFWITYRSGQIILNPILIAFGWKFYEVSYRFPTSATTYISKALVHGDDISPGERHRQVAIQDTLIIKNKTINRGHDNADSSRAS